MVAADARSDGERVFDNWNPGLAWGSAAGGPRSLEHAAQDRGVPRRVHGGGRRVLSGKLSGGVDPERLGSGFRRRIRKGAAVETGSTAAEHNPDPGRAIAYLGAAVYAIAGPRKRWLRRPWLALIFGANCLSLGLASTVLVLTQAFVIGEWCFLCLVAAACSYSLVILAAGELFATVKFLLGVWRSGGAAGAIRTAWLGRVEER
jgi:hypothetical protein